MTLQNEPLNRGEIKKKYCRFKKNGIKYIDYKDANFLLKFVNEQGKILQALVRRLENGHPIAHVRRNREASLVGRLRLS